MSTTACVYRPKMGSSSGMPDSGLPFGYNVSDELLYRPPSPRGDPILGPSDNNLLGTFFNGIESNTFSFGEGVAFPDQWLDQCAPNLLGHSTSFGPQPPLDLAPTTMAALPPHNFENVYIFGQNTMPPPPPPPPPARPPVRRPPPSPVQQPRPQSQPTIHPFHQDVTQTFHDQRSLHIPMEEDVHVDVAALLATLQSGHPAPYPPRTSSLGSFPPPANVQPPRDYGSSISQPRLEQPNNDPVRPTRSNEPDTLFTDMMFGTQDSGAHRPAEPPRLQWGSDALFARGQGFVPPRQHESSEALESKRLATVREALHIARSTSNTRASSPTGSKETATHAALENSNGYIQSEDHAATPPRKRRKSKAKIETDEDGDYTGQLASRATARKRKSKGELNRLFSSSSPVQETSGKRRKSAASQPKPPRENLTDAQKRENHIKSEQKRRGAIKEGFDDLTFIVPNLQNGGYSKSNILSIAGEWLESLIKGNQALDPNGTPTL